MSLRIFHIVFVVCAIGISAFTSAWGFLQYAQRGSGTGLSIAILFLLAALALVFYGVRVFHKLKELP